MMDDSSLRTGQQCNHLIISKKEGRVLIPKFCEVSFHCDLKSLTTEEISVSPQLLGCKTQEIDAKVKDLTYFAASLQHHKFTQDLYNWSNLVNTL